MRRESVLLSRELRSIAMRPSSAQSGSDAVEISIRRVHLYLSQHIPRKDLMRSMLLGSWEDFRDRSARWNIVVLGRASDCCDQP
jgi:hypothetical protein